MNFLEFTEPLQYGRPGSMRWGFSSEQFLCLHLVGVEMQADEKIK